MPRRRVTAGAALVVAGALAVPALGPAFATGEGSHVTIDLRSVIVQETELDLGEPGFGPGDQYVFASDLLRWDDGRPTGDYAAACTFARVEDGGQAAVATCLATLRLPRGQITLQGLVTFSEDLESFDVAVTGGSGRYAGAGGTATIRFMSETVERYTLRLRLPRR
jgi:hypothetical protein